MPNQYPWYCISCDQEFLGGDTSPEKCAKCGRKTNGGFGLPFAAYPDRSRVDIANKTFEPYEGDSEWVRSANKILEGEALVGAQLKELVDQGLRLTKRQAKRLIKQVFESEKGEQ
jgi:hypothetical protein